MKDAESAELKKAINCIMQGETYIQPSLVPALNSRLVSRDIDKEKINSLTKRELEVLIEVANGMFNKEIATSLNISERTVKIIFLISLKKLMYLIEHRQLCLPSKMI